MEFANCKSRSEFLDQAAVFYAGYIATQNSEEFLSPTLAASLRAALNDSEGRTARLLFKLSVEMSMMMHMIAATAEIDEETLRKLRGKAVSTSPGKSPLPTHVCLRRNQFGPFRDSVVMLEQLRTLNRSRLREYMGTLDAESLRRVDQALAISIGLSPVEAACRA